MEGAEQRPEELINSYAKAGVGVRKIANAIGFLALLWSTVVLLGGFVSVLTIKDFWSLSVLSLLMASKMLEFIDTNNGGIFMAEKHILRLSKGLDQLEEANRARHRIILFTLSTMKVVKQISIIILLCIFGFPWQLSIGLSVARLVQRDYGDADGDAANRAKLNAALIVFYVLVIFHGLSVGYWAFLQVFEPWTLLSKQFGFGVWGPKIVNRYRTETRVKCHKDGVLPNNWNLITFSVGLLESASPDDRLWGARVFDTFIGKGISIRQELLSSSQAIQNLINMIIGSTRTDDPETRERGARIVADLARELRINQFPDVLRCICCLLESCKPYNNPQFTNPLAKQTLDETSDNVSAETLERSHHQEDAHLSLEITNQAEHNKVVNLASDKVPKRRSCIQIMRIRMKTTSFKEAREWDRYFGDEYHYSYVSKGTKELISQGLVILERLTQDEENCIEIVRHQRLVSRITLPLSYHDFLCNGCDHTWADKSLTMVSRLISAKPADDTTRLRCDMSASAVTIRNLMRILEVEVGASELHEQAIDILTELAFDDSFRKLAFDESTSMTEMLSNMLRRIFLEESNATVAKEDEEKDMRVRRKAGEALARLLIRVTSARDNTDAVTSVTNVNAGDLLPKQDVINLLSKVVDKILSTKVEKDADVVTLAGSSNSCHVEMVVESQPPNGADTSESSTQPEEGKMLAALLNLAVAICTEHVISGDEFTRAVPDKAALVMKLKEIVRMDKGATSDGWRIQKFVCQLVIAMVQLKPSCIREFNERNFKETLSKALETMSDVDNCMMFAGDDREVLFRSLASLVKEAHKLLAQELGGIPV
ncbi:uncharacterized protein LOC119292360 [Triticum dicoccoides]|uniref:uncharacterized protein LOC119292360 n=1 Tax=Triticum dicoccoides TaxID=85692 RepID=UPI00188FD058|nr:uncharacterized protein LOC119292360 [Triticum dicoccoides]